MVAAIAAADITEIALRSTGPITRGPRNSRTKRRPNTAVSESSR